MNSSSSNHAKNNEVKLSPSVSNGNLHLRRFFWRWHRRLGLIALLLVVILAVTGVMLNHTDTLKLSHTPLRNTLLLTLYGVKPPTVTSFKLGDTWYSDTGSHQLYRNGKQSIYCNNTLVGAAQLADLHVIGCSNELLLLTNTGDVVERIGSTYGIPSPITHLGQCQHTLCINTPNGIYHIDLQQLAWQATNDTAAQWSTPATAPDALLTTLRNDYLGSDLNWERVILDLHSGRLFGTVGVLAMDAAAVLLVLLGISGLWLWWSGPGRKGRRSKKRG